MNNKELIELAQTVSMMLEEEYAKLPYSANVIDELHANENAHSRVLRMLLQYSGGQTWPVYRSFLILLNRLCPSIPLNFNNPVFVNEKDRIDLLINDYFQGKKTAIIIENKICNAGDQDEQIERYIKKQEDAGVAAENIFVIYLTSDGTKMVSDHSLTNIASNKLGYKGEEEKGHFIELNYRYDILPWIEQDVLPNITIREELLVSSLRLYIDYLKGLFGLRNDEELIHKQIQQKMENSLGVNISSIKEGYQLLDSVNNLQSEISEIIRRKANNLLEEHLKKPLSVFLKQFGGTVSGVEYYADNRFCCCIEFATWKKARILINQEDGGIYGIVHNDFDSNPLDEKVVLALRELFPGTKKSNWWPSYNKLDKLDASAGSVDIWISIESEQFYHFFEKWIKDVFEKTKGLEL